MDFLSGLVLLFVAFAFTSTLTVIIHELGHAIAGLILFNGDLEVYIGSYGNAQNTIYIELGRLKIFFKYKIYYWKGGLCRTVISDTSLIKRYIFTLCGPLASLVVFFISFYVLVFSDYHGALKLLALTLMLSSFIDFLYNIIPDKSPIVLDNGNVTYNDGQTLKQYLQLRGAYKDIIKLAQLHEENKIDEGLEYFNSIVSPKSNPILLSMGFSLLFSSGQYYELIKFIELIKKDNKWTSADYAYYALAHSQLKKYEEAIKFYDESLKLDPHNIEALNNRGYTYILISNYEQAINDADKVLEKNPNYAYSLNNRGFAKIKLGKLESGFQDVVKSLQLDNKNSYAFKSLSFYYLAKENLELAKFNLSKAEIMDANTHGLDELKELIKEKDLIDK